MALGEIPGLHVKITADTSALNGAVSRANNSLSSFDAKTANTNRSLANLKGSLLSAKGAVLSLTGALTVREIIQYGDAWTSVNNKIRQVADTNASFLDSQQAVINIAKETRSNLEATASLYSRTARQADKLGISLADVGAFTKGVNQALQSYGATAQESASATLQLSQALGKGVLNGDEFRAVAEAAPPILDAIAKAANVSVGALKDMGAEGKLTADLVVKGVLLASKTFEDDFSKAVATASSKMEVARTNAIQFVGTSKNLAAAINNVGDGAISLSENMDAIAKAVLAVTAIYAGRHASALAAAASSQMAVIAANKARVVTELALAKSANLRAIQDQLAAQRSLANATNDTLRAAAITRLAAANQIATVAQSRLNIATAAYSAIATTAGLAARAFSSSLMLIGGPIGAAVLAAAAVASFQEELGLVSSPAKIASAELGKLRKQFDGLAESQANQALVSMKVRMVELQSSVSQANEEMKRALGDQSVFGKLNPNSESNQAIKRATELTSELAAQMRQVSEAEQILGIVKRPSGVIPEKEKNDNTDTDRQKLADKLEAIRQSYLSEQAMLDEKLALELETIAAGREAELGLGLNYDQMELDAKAAHEAALTGIEVAEKEKRERAERSTNAFRLQQSKAVYGELANLLAQFGGKHKAAALASLAIQKALAMSAVATSTAAAVPLAVASQLVPGDPSSAARGLALAGKIKAMGAIQMGLIAATGLAEGASIGGSSGGGGGFGVAGGTNSPQQPQQAAAPSGPNRVINVTGIAPDTLITGRMMIDLINEAEADGARLVISR